MLRKLAELHVKKNDDYYNEVVKSLEKEGFTVILEVETTLMNYYLIAKEEKLIRRKRER